MIKFLSTLTFPLMVLSVIFHALVYAPWNDGRVVFMSWLIQRQIDEGYDVDEEGDQ